MSEVRIKCFKRVLVANRGEIAIRVFRALNELGITSVAIYSKEDKYAMFRTLADEAYPLNPEKGPIDAYLDIPTIIKIAKDHNIDAIHPGYGFLAENPVLVEECTKNGIVFIGPTVESMNAMGDKISSKQIAIASDVPIIPGVDHAMKTTEEAMEVARKVGYPVMLKASNGGGGRGMRIVNSEEEMAKEFKEAIDESKKAFGDDKIFLEKYLEKSGCDPQDSVLVASRSQGSLIEARLQLENNEMRQNFHRSFADWMRMCFRLDIAAIQSFSERMGTMGREQLKFFLENCMDELQGCLMTNNRCTQWLNASEEERSFWKNFSAYVSNQNIQQYYTLFNQAIFLVGRNIYAPALLTDMSLELCRIIAAANKELKRKNTR